MKNVIITGASGFIGTALCRQLPSDGNTIIGVDITKGHDKSTNIVWEQADLTDSGSVSVICERFFPHVIIHCAAIAHQKIGTADSATYMRVNREVTENIAKAASEYNNNLTFIFLSSVSVYGEDNLSISVSEVSECHPSSDYAVSKLDAEKRLIALYNEEILYNLVILRLAPVYDREWSLNLDRRVFAPKKLAYLRFGSGSQRISALARPNLVNFIKHILQSTDYADFRRLKDGGINNKRKNLKIYNVCDAEAYDFNRIIRVFRKSGIRPNRPVISVPLFVVWFATRIAGIFFSRKRKWIHSFYDKLSSDLVFDNGKMMETGFRAKSSLETIMREGEIGDR